METITLDWNDPTTWIVLVADDEPDNLEIVAQSLVYHGAAVRTALDGVATLGAIEEFKPNLILLDLSMPKMNGWETRAHIKADPQTSAIPVIALTAHAMAGDAERALAAGFNGYLTKPISIMNLIGDLRKAVQDVRPLAEEK